MADALGSVLEWTDALYPAANALGGAVLFLLAVLALSIVLEVLQQQKAVVVLLNCLFIAPVSAALLAAFYVLAPLRWLYCRWLNMVATRIISLGTMWPSMKDASFDGTISAVQIGYRGLFLGKNVLDLDAREVRAHLDGIFSLWPFGPQGPLRKWLRKHLPISTLRLCAVRVVIAAALVPSLGWWLVGVCYVPFLPMPRCRRRGSDGDDDELFPDVGNLVQTAVAEQRRRHCRTAQAPKSAAPAAPPAAPAGQCATAEGDEDSATVTFAINDCRFLRQARSHFKSLAVGDTACVNE